MGFETNLHKTETQHVKKHTMQFISRRCEDFLFYFTQKSNYKAETAKECRCSEKSSSNYIKHLEITRIYVYIIDFGPQVLSELNDK